MTTIDLTLLVTAGLLIVSVIASKASARVGVPALLLFIGIGVLAGSEGPGGIYFDNYSVAQAVGIVALVFILFDGGISTDWTEVRPVLWKGLSLSTVGVVSTAALVGVCAKYLVELSWLEAFLLGAIVSSTDAAAVFSVLRSRNSTLKGQTQPLLEFESGSNDPMAVFLTVGLIQLFKSPQLGIWSLIPLFVQQMALGAVLGYLGGRVLVLVINRLKLEYEGLYPVLSLSAMLLLYSGTSTVGGSGFLAVYIAGLVMGNSYYIHKLTLVRFHNGLAWMMQIAMFLTLGLLVFPSHLVPVAFAGSILALFLMFVARPVSVFLALGAAKGLSKREKVMAGWVGLRGAAPIILATFPLLAGLPKAELLFNLVFFIVLISVSLQGTSIPLAARWLKLAAPLARKRKTPFEFEPQSTTDTNLTDITVPKGSAAIGKQIFELGLPREVLIVLITRGDHYVVPRGETTLQSDDHLLVLADKRHLDAIRSVVEA